jgi:hypothetical protein
MTARQRKWKKDARSLYQARNPNPWMPIGYYANRRHRFLPRPTPSDPLGMRVQIGQIEGFRFISSPTI